MEIAISEAKAQLTDLVRRAEAGEEVILTRHGHAAVRLAPVKLAASPEERRQAIRELRARAAAKIQPGISAARSQDFLYDDNGMPG